MNMDIRHTLREERCKEFRQEAERERQLKAVPRSRQAWGWHAAGRLGSAMVAAGHRLERLESGEQPAVYDL